MKKELIFIVLIIFLITFISAADNNPDDIKITYNDGNLQSWNSSFDIGTSREANPVKLIKGDGKIVYNHNGNEKREYDGVAANGSFVFKDKKLKEADFTTTKDSEYSFGNQKVKVPKGAHVIFKDNKVTVELPKDALIEKPNKIPNSKDEDVKVEYRYKQGEEPDKIKIKDNGKEYEIKKFGSNKFQVNYDGKADAFKVDGKFEMNGLRVGEYSKDDETYLFFDGNAHDDLKGSYISIGDKKLIIGSSGGEFSSTVQFLPGNGILTVDDKKLVMIQAIGGEKGGSLKVESRDPQGMIPKITAQTGYNFFSGDKVLKYVDSYKDKYKGPIQLTKNPIGASGKESIPIQIVTLDKTGSRIGDWDVIIDSYGSMKAGTASQLEGQLSSIRQGFVTSIRAGFHGLTKEEQAKIGTLNPEKQRELAGSDINKLRDELKKRPVLDVKTFGSTGNVNVLNDVRDHKNKLGIDNTYEDSDPVTTVHETTHGINSKLSDSENAGFYLLEGKYVKIKKPSGVTLADVRKNVPDSLKNSDSYNLYLVQQARDWNSEPLYVLDELTSYTNGGIYATQNHARNSMNVPEFMAYSLAMGKTIMEKNPNYWNSAQGQELKNFLQYSLDRAMEVHIKQSGSSENAAKSLKNMLNNNLINFAQNSLGGNFANNI